METTYLQKQILSAAGLLTAIGIPATEEMIERVIKTAGEALEDELLCEWIIKYAPIAPQEGKQK